MRVFWGLVVVCVLGCTRLGFEDRRPLRVPDGGTDVAAPDLTPPDSTAPDQTVDLPAVAQSTIHDPTTGIAWFQFKAGWALPHTLTWVWRCARPVPDFERYELCVAKTVADLASGKARCLTPQDDITLEIGECQGGWHLGQINDLEPDTAYWGTLKVHDSVGVTFVAPPVMQRTSKIPKTRVALWSDSFPPGVTSTTLTASTSKPRAGTHHLLAQQTAADTWLELELDGFSLAQLPGLDAARFAHAYIEYQLDSPSVERIDTVLQNTAGKFAVYGPPAGYSAVDGKPGYQRIQVPLWRPVWQGTSTPIDHTDLAAMDRLLIGAYFAAGPIYLDEVAIVY